MAMNCPVCREPMLVVEYAQIELDACQSCKGFWFDAGELDLLLEKAGIPEPDRGFETLLVPAGTTREAIRRCPLCHKKMTKAKIGPAGPLVDRCARQEGIWFDRGELGEALAAAGAPGPALRVLSYLHDLFPDKARKETGT